MNRRLTVPPVDDPKVMKYQDLIYPITSTLFIAWAKFHPLEAIRWFFGVPLWMFLLTVGLEISLVLFFVVKKRDLKCRPRKVSNPKPKN